MSTIGEERAFNPRLQVTSIDDYVTLMNSLNLPNPKMMDVAVPANMHIGLAQKIVADRGWALSAEDAKGMLQEPDIALVDLREDQERKRDGVIPGSVHVTYPDMRGKPASGRVVAAARALFRQALDLLLLLRLAIRHGGAGGASRGVRRLPPYPWRLAGLEKRRRPAGEIVRPYAASAGQRAALRSTPRFADRRSSRMPMSSGSASQEHRPSALRARGRVRTVVKYRPRDRQTPAGISRPVHLRCDRTGAVLLSNNRKCRKAPSSPSPLRSSIAPTGCHPLAMRGREATPRHRGPEIRMRLTANAPSERARLTRTATTGPRCVQRGPHSRSPSEASG